MATAIRRYVRRLGLDAYVVGGAVRDELLGLEPGDEDFLVPGLDHAGLRVALEPYGRVEEMEVHGQLVGVRLHPADRAIRKLARAGIELTPPRAERSTGPGHTDFEISTGANVSIAEDLARRDFTVNAIAKRLSDGSLIDPHGGVADLARRELRMVRAEGFVDDPLRILRGLRLVSQLGFTLAGCTFAAMRAHAEGLQHVSSERIGGGIAADGRGELSKLLLGRDPRTALKLARETGALAVVLPEVGRDDGPAEAVAEAAAAGAPLAVRLAALFNRSGARAAGTALDRLRYPVALRRRVQTIIAAHEFPLPDEPDARAARRLLREHGTPLADDLVALRHALGRPGERPRLGVFAQELERERGAVHTFAGLAIDGSDLLGLGLREGPEVGQILACLLDRVVDEPALNDRETLLALALERG